MSKLYYGSICLTDLNNAAKQGHSAFSKSAKNGKIYVNINVWENDQPDEYKQTHAIQVGAKKDSADERFYIGNLRPSELQPAGPVSATDVPNEDDLPF